MPNPEGINQYTGGGGGGKTSNESPTQHTKFGPSTQSNGTRTTNVGHKSSGKAADPHANNPSGKASASKFGRQEKSGNAWPQRADERHGGANNVRNVVYSSGGMGHSK